ncbi:conserved hypothetical protein [Leishmania major strain Friedlin]|uniref:Transmembrane protein n=1 Tax=Leishmania major TaxID=5664 RepID=E9AD82_LEIMA|nr:conserved hypothetical protein [Leishmania major strain Friedlin]CAG9576707.1 hypothetical_protein_-_conserved [Leishmania major strain Friedlin]CBZ12167.1 conserved hypothetical protein [Leishmania major strain Friedlin]|eukprot:XP_003721911.1 conserved hypothetical protein [Leishmania major strain Friedlin]
MLRRCFPRLEVLRPAVERRKRRGRAEVGGAKKVGSRNPGMPDLPKSAGGYVFQQLRLHLPIRWRYGWRWSSLKAVWVGGWSSFICYVAYVMFFKYTDSEIAEQATQYTYVRNDRGEVVDIGFKPIVDAGRRARRRADRLLDPDERD